MSLRLVIISVYTCVATLLCTAIAHCEILVRQYVTPDAVNVIYDVLSGDVNVTTGSDLRLTTLQIMREGSITFSAPSVSPAAAQRPPGLQGHADIYREEKIFKFDPSGFSELSVLSILPIGLDVHELTTNTVVNGSLLGGGSLSDALGGGPYLLVVPDSGSILHVGDYNNNGTVEQGDLDLVLVHWGENAAVPPTGWVQNLPAGTVDQNELDAVLLNWGESFAGRANSSGAATNVPEPTGVLMLCIVAGIAAVSSNFWHRKGRKCLGLDPSQVLGKKSLQAQSQSDVPDHRRLTSRCPTHARVFVLCVSGSLAAERVHAQQIVTLPFIPQASGTITRDNLGALDVSVGDSHYSWSEPSFRQHAIFEFDTTPLIGLDVESAQLQLRSRVSSVVRRGDHNVFLFSGDGVLSPSDYDEPGISVGSVPSQLDTTFQFRLDEWLEQNQAGTNLGIRIEPAQLRNTQGWRSPTLSISTIAPPDAVIRLAFGETAPFRIVEQDTLFGLRYRQTIQGEATPAGHVPANVQTEVIAELDGVFTARPSHQNVSQTAAFRENRCSMRLFFVSASNFPENCPV